MPDDVELTQQEANPDPIPEAPVKKYGIQETIDCAKALAYMGMRGVEVKKWNFTSITAEIFPMAERFVKAVDGIGEVPNEINDMDAEEGEMVIVAFMKEFNLTRSQAEEAVEEFFKAVVHIVRGAMIFKNMDRAAIPPKSV